MLDLRTDLEALRDECLRIGASDLYTYAYRSAHDKISDRLTALLAAHPAGPDLLEAASEALNALLDYVPTLEKQGGSMFYGRKVIRMLQAALTAHTEAWEGSERCVKCDRAMEMVLTCPMCGGHYCNVERRKGGGR